MSLTTAQLPVRLTPLVGRESELNDIVQAVSPVIVPTIPIEYNRYLFMPTVDGRELTSHPLWLLNNAPAGVVNFTLNLSTFYSHFRIFYVL